jgi:hypothetical protein
MPNKADSENIVMLETHHVRNYEEFSYIDSSLQYYNENEDRVEQTAAKQQKTTENQKTAEDDTTERGRVNSQDVRKLIAGLMCSPYLCRKA